MGDRNASRILRRGVAASLIAGCLILSCALPGKLYPVAPAISGRLLDFNQSPGSAKLQLVVLGRESPDLHARQEVVPTTGGRFHFARTQLKVAGHEYTKFYQLYLHLQDDSSDRVIWRAAISRLALSGPVELECDLRRAPLTGEPCQVQNPLSQKWLVENGHRTYHRLCASCHGPSGQRELAKVPSDVRPPPDLRMIAARHGGRFDRDKVVERIEGLSTPDAHRSGGMPIWGKRLSDQFKRYAEGDELVGALLDPLVVYLESLQGTTGPKTD
jgi:hypothetical protein